MTARPRCRVAAIPAFGVEDLYASVVTKLGGVKLVAAWHQFTADTGGQDQKATCGHAVYDVKEQNVVMTKDDPTVSRGKDVVKAEKIFMWLDSGEIEMENPKVQDMELKQFAK